MSENMPSYSISVPVFVLEDREISPTAKLLYGVIDSFLKRSGVCYATNSRLADEVAGCSERTISRCVSELKDAGYIKVGLLPKQKDKQPVRQITLAVSVNDGQGVDKNGDTPTPILSTPHANIGVGVIQEVIKKESEKEKVLPPDPKKKRAPQTEDFDPLPLFLAWIGAMDASRDEKNALYFAITRFLENRAVLKKPYKSKSGVTALCNRLRRLSGDRIPEMIALLDRATDNGWQSVYPEGGDKAPAAPQNEGKVYAQW